MCEEGVDRFLVALNDVEDALRQPGFGQPFRDQDRRGGVPLGRFENKAIATGQGDGEHPHRHHDGEVEPRDPRDNAQRLTDRVAVDAGADVFGELALQKVRRADGEFDNLEAAGHLALGVVVGLAVLTRNHSGQLVGTIPQDRLEPVEHAGAPQLRCLRPCRPAAAAAATARATSSVEASATFFSLRRLPD